MLILIEGKDNKTRGGILRFGMVGGASGSFIGDVHRKGAVFDGQAQLVAGCFSPNYERTVLTGENLGLDPTRLYRSHDEMAEKEAARDDGIDFVIIAAPTTHYAAAKPSSLRAFTSCVKSAVIYGGRS